MQASIKSRVALSSNQRLGHVRCVEARRRGAVRTVPHPTTDTLQMDEATFEAGMRGPVHLAQPIHLTTARFAEVVHKGLVHTATTEDYAALVVYQPEYQSKRRAQLEDVISRHERSMVAAQIQTAKKGYKSACTVDTTMMQLVQKLRELDKSILLRQLWLKQRNPTLPANDPALEQQACLLVKAQKRTAGARLPDPVHVEYPRLDMSSCQARRQLLLLDIVKYTQGIKACHITAAVLRMHPAYKFDTASAGWHLLHHNLQRLHAAQAALKECQQRLQVLLGTSSIHL